MAQEIYPPSLIQNTAIVPPGNQKYSEPMPALGLLTWSSEGNSQESSRWFSRRAHTPSPGSGITIGRGYDLSLRSSAQIRSDLHQAGLADKDVIKFAKASMKTGLEAQLYMKQIALPELSAEQELRLFTIDYARQSKDAERIYTSEAGPGSKKWQDLNPKLREVFVDLRYRGDLTPGIKQKVIHAIKSNVIGRLETLLSDKKLWLEQQEVPLERYKARLRYIKSAE